MRKRDKFYRVFLGIIVISFVFIVTYIFKNQVFISKNFKSSTKDELKPKIVLLAHVYNNPYWSYVKEGAEKAAEERGAVIEYNGPQAASIKDGIKLIDMAIASKAAGIITYVQDEEEYAPYINKAIEKGIPVVTVDSDDEKSNRISYVGTDNIKAGKAAGVELISKIGTYGNVGIIMGGKEVKNQRERVQGFTDHLRDFSRINIVSIESSGSYLLEAEMASKRILRGSKKVDALFCSSALDGVGAAKAVKDLNMQGKITIICFDDLPETLQNIKEGIVYAAIVQKPYEMGYRGVNLIIDKLNGKEIKKNNLTDIIVVKKDNLHTYN